MKLNFICVNDLCLFNLTIDWTRYSMKGPSQSIWLFCLHFIASASGISFNVAHHRHTCLQEDIHKDVLVVGEYTISEDLVAPINLEVGSFTCVRCEFDIGSL